MIDCPTFCVILLDVHTWFHVVQMLSSFSFDHIYFCGGNATYWNAIIMTMMIALELLKIIKNDT